MKSFKSKNVMFLIFIMLMAMTLTSFAAVKQIKPISDDSIKIKVNGEVKKFFDQNTKEQLVPILHNGRIYLPIKDMSDSLDLKIEWDEIAKTILIIKKDDVIKAEKLEAPKASLESGKYNGVQKITFTNQYSNGVKIYYKIMSPNMMDVMPKVDSADPSKYMSLWDGNPITISVSSKLTAVAVERDATGIIRRSLMSIYNYNLNAIIKISISPRPTGVITGIVKPTIIPKIDVLEAPKASLASGIYTGQPKVTFVNQYASGVKIYYKLISLNTVFVLPKEESADLSEYVDLWDGNPITIAQSSKLVAVAVRQNADVIVGRSGISTYSYRINKEVIITSVPRPSVTGIIVPKPPITGIVIPKPSVTGILLPKPPVTGISIPKPTIRITGISIPKPTIRITGIQIPKVSPIIVPSSKTGITVE